MKGILKWNEFSSFRQLFLVGLGGEQVADAALYLGLLPLFVLQLQGTNAGWGGLANLGVSFDLGKANTRPVVDINWI